MKSSEEAAARTVLSCRDGTGPWCGITDPKHNITMKKRAGAWTSTQGDERRGCSEREEPYMAIMLIYDVSGVRKYIAIQCDM